MIRRMGQVPERGVQYRMRPGAYAVICDRRDVLLTLTDELQLPGGGIDPGETAVQALHREVMEETGWGIHNARRIGAFRRFAYLPDYGFHAEKLCHIYLARPTLRRSAPTEPGHIAVWMPLRNAVDAMEIPGDGMFLKQVLDGVV